MLPAVISPVVSDDDFFAPVSSGVVDGLIEQYDAMRQRLVSVHAIVQGEMSAAMQYFFEGNRDERGRGDTNAAQIFQLDGAIAALNAAYWSKALAFTDVLDCMPQKRRDDWNNQIKQPKGVKAQRGRYSDGREWEIEPLPDFTAEAVRPTIAGLLSQRHQFFSERVDGIFRGLSGEHVTNAPEAFGKRMIMNYMLSYGSINHSRAGLINDLRCVIAKFMGRDEPGYLASSVLVKELYRNTGEWNTIDGGALRIRVYKKGTAHMEVHPDIAWRLNQVLAYMHPMAIPAEFRQKPKKRAKEFAVLGRPLPFAVLELLGENWSSNYRRNKDDYSFRFNPSAIAKPESKAAHQEAIRVLLSIGGVMNKHGGFDFDYDYTEVIRSIVVTGCVPDKKSHQFYPTPASVGAVAVQMAAIGPNDTCLEPSAGQGDLAALLPADRTTCVEISPLHCAILKARGFTTEQADFIAWAEHAAPVDRVVMNPPFADGRAQAHVEAAANLVKPGGRLVAVLPASFKGKKVLPGWTLEWSEVFANEFDGTGVSVVVMSASKSNK